MIIILLWTGYLEVLFGLRQRQKLPLSLFVAEEHFMPKAFFIFLVLLSVFCLNSAEAAGLQCDQFQKNANGSWSAKTQVQISNGGASIMIGPGMQFGPGAAFGGINLYELLEANCK